MEVNQGLTTPEEDVLEDTEVQTEEEMQGTIEAVEEDPAIKAVKIATAVAVDGNNCKT